MVCRCCKLSEKTSLLIMMTMTFIFFLAEIITGYMTNSVALVADSFHMLSDVLSIIIAYLAVHFSGKTTLKNTYNWARSEILGAMVNAVFLMALCFTIFVSAIQRLIVVEVVEKPLLILGVGVAGIVVNLIGLVMFGAHVHHGHSHGTGHAHNHKRTHARVKELDAEDLRHQDELNGNQISVRSNTMEKLHTSTCSSVEIGEETAVVTGGRDPSSHGQMNMKAVFLHVLGDALGSVVVIISALIIQFTEGDWRYHMDPAMSLVIVVIISFTTIPLLKNAGMILLQNPPPELNLIRLKEDVCQVAGILGVHELHIWQLSSKCIIATIHIVMRQGDDFISAALNIKKIFHNVGIHSTTIQPEFVGENMTLQKLSPPLHTEDIRMDISTNGLGNTLNATEERTTVRHRGSFNDKLCLLACELESCKPHICCKPPDYEELECGTMAAFENKTFH